MTILVTGATGTVGRLVVRGLAERTRGAFVRSEGTKAPRVPQVRAMSRRPEAGMVYGDLDDPECAGS